MTEAELNRVRMEIHRVVGTMAQPRMGRITAFSSSQHAVKVAILPESDFPLNEGEIAETGWIPLSPVTGGNGVGVYAPPAIGTQVMVNHQEGAAGSGVVIATINDEANPPPGAAAGEFWMTLHNGARLVATNDGGVALAAARTIGLTAPGGVTITAPGLSVSGNTNSGTGYTGSLTDVRGRVATFRCGVLVNVFPP